MRESYDTTLKLPIASNIHVSTFDIIVIDSCAWRLNSLILIHVITEYMALKIIINIIVDSMHTWVKTTSDQQNHL